MTTRPASLSSPASAFVAGIAVIAAYAALAAWSGSLSRSARGPLLDGLGPVNYRWVSPPPELAATNQEPSSGRFDLPLLEGGVGTQVVFTSDSQVTVVIDDGSIGTAPKQRSVELLVEPVDPAELAPPGRRPRRLRQRRSLQRDVPALARSGSATWTGRSR